MALFSERFGYLPEFLYLVSITQFVCALLLFVRFLAHSSSGILTVLSLGAGVSHLKINSPVTALPALGYTAIQIWYGVTVNRENCRQQT